MLIVFCKCVASSVAAGGELRFVIEISHEKHARVSTIAEIERSIGDGGVKEVVANECSCRKEQIPIIYCRQNENTKATRFVLSVCPHQFEDGILYSKTIVRPRGVGMLALICQRIEDLYR